MVILAYMSATFSAKCLIVEPFSPEHNQLPLQRSSKESYFRGESIDITNLKNASIIEYADPAMNLVFQGLY